MEEEKRLLRLLGKIIRAFQYLLTHSFRENCALISFKIRVLFRKLKSLYRNIKKRLKKIRKKAKEYLKKIRDEIKKCLKRVEYRYHKWHSMIPLPRKHVQYSKKPFGTPCAVSVIIPVYNAQEYLADCLDSIFSQTLQDFEVICVDDGSQDDSVNILEAYQEKHQNMKVLTQKNQYAGIARNYGLSIANGEYVLFVDADDLIRGDTLEKTYAKAKAADADVVVFGAAVFSHGHKKAEPVAYQLKTSYLPEQDPFNRKDIPDHILIFTPGGPCNKLFRRAMVEETGLRFKGFRSSNNLGFVIPFLALADRITTVNEPFYFIRRGLSTNLSSTRDKNPLLGFQAYEDMQNTLKQHGVYEEVKRSFLNFALGGCIYGMSVIHSDELRHEMEEKFLADYRFRFEIADKLERHFFLRSRYKQYCEMLERHPGHKKVVIPESEILISVIIPMYNCGAYVDPLVKKLMKQTLQNFEIICVDDGSTDDTRERVEDFQKQYSNIRYIYKENGGAGTARNCGLHEARGRYVMFLDADDIYNPEMLEKLSDAALAYDGDVINCLFEREDYWRHTTSEVLGYRKADLPKKPYFKPVEIDDIFHTFTQGPINKMFNREFLLKKNLTFSATRIANDVKFVVLALIEADRIVCIEDSLITVRRYVNENSISSQRGKYLAHMVTVYREIYEGMVNRNLINAYKYNLCSAFGNSIHYNAQYAQSQEFVDAVVGWLQEKPWSDFSKQKMCELLKFTLLDVRKQELENLRRDVQNCAEDQRKEKELQLALAENRLANLENIQNKMKERGLL